MMEYKVTSLYHEPVVIYLLRSRGIYKVPQRTTRNLLPDESITIDESEVSPEIKLLAHPSKKCIKLEKIDRAKPPDGGEEIDLVELERQLLADGE
jgi:hypothetical protein